MRREYYTYVIRISEGVTYRSPKKRSTRKGAIAEARKSVHPDRGFRIVKVVEEIDDDMTYVNRAPSLKKLSLTGY